MPASPLSRTTCPSPALGPCPPLPQQSQFEISANQRGETCTDCELKATLGLALPHDTVQRERSRHSLQGVRTTVLTLEQACYEPIRSRADDYGIGFSFPLHTRCNGRRLAQGELLMLAPSPYLSYDDQTGMNTDTDL